MSQLEDRIEAVEHSLSPQTPIAGERYGWSIAERMDFYRVPGVSLAVMNDGAVAWAKGYGRRDLDEPNLPVAPDTLFQAASMSKPVTGAAVMMLVQDGLLDLDVNVNYYLKSWTLPENHLTEGNPVTLRKVLSHTAGLSGHGWPGYKRGRQIPTIQQVLDGEPPAESAPVRVVLPPGAQNQYAGGGTLIAQLCVEDVSGMDFDTFTRERLFAPLGIAQSCFEQPLSRARSANAAAGHRVDPRTITGKWRVLPQLGAGGLWTTARDYAAFMLGLQKAYKGLPGGLMDQTLAREMMTISPPGLYGLGPRVLGEGETRFFEHGGSQQGYKSESFCYLEEGRGAVVLTNGDNGSLLAFEILNAVAEAYGWRGYAREPKPIFRLPPETLDKYVGRYRVISGMEIPHVAVRRDGDQLMSVMAGVPDTPLFASSTQDFFSPYTPYDIRFEFADDGRAERILVFERGAEIMVTERDDK